MEITRKNHLWLENSEDAHRQYIDAVAVFTAWETARKEAAEVRGGMLWKSQNGADYLIRTSVKNSQKSLGPRSETTEAIFNKFTDRKKQTESRLHDLREALVRHQRMNRALHVGRAPRLLVEILNRLFESGLDDYFTIIGTHAMYAYESAAGVRIGSSDAMTTRDVDLLWDTRKKISFETHMETIGTSFLGVLNKVDATFQLHKEQRYTAVNCDGFEVDVIRREPVDGDLHPWRMTDSEDDEFYDIQAKRAGKLLDGPKFSSVIVASSGHMARMKTISPLVFSEFKRWMSTQSDREPHKRRRDILQADVVEELVSEYLPYIQPLP
jgi:hypothetical protein